MPDGGSAGWYSDPVNTGPRYETYAFDELLPWVDATFRSDRRRAVAGLSMGGFGALKYAARHPGTFQAAASYSGVMDAPSFAQNGYANLIPDTVWGPRADATSPAGASTTRSIWRANLRGLKLLELRTGNGLPGPLDTRTGRDNLETEVWRENTALHAKLDELGIAHVYDDYGPGVHDWPYWARGLAADAAQSDRGLPRHRARHGRRRRPGRAEPAAGRRGELRHVRPGHRAHLHGRDDRHRDLDRGRRDAVRRRPRPPDQRRVLTRNSPCGSTAPHRRAR